MKVKQPEKNALWFGYGCCLSSEDARVVHAWMMEMRHHFSLPLLLDEDRSMGGAFMIVCATSSVSDAHFLGVQVLPEEVETIADAHTCVSFEVGPGRSVFERWQWLQQFAHATGLSLHWPEADFLLMREENGKP